MALLVEDGTGIAGAESYMEIADIASYAVGRGLSFVVSPTAPAEAAARRAAKLIDEELVDDVIGGGELLGSLLDDAAARWPDRTAVIDAEATLSYAQLDAAAAIQSEGNVTSANNVPEAAVAQSAGCAPE